MTISLRSRYHPAVFVSAVAAVLAIAAAVSVACAGNGPTPLSPAWFAARAGGGLGASASAQAAAPQLQSLKNVQTSLQSLNTAKAALQKAMAAQAAASASAASAPNGLTIGGLQVLPGSTPLNATPPTQTSANNHTTVTIKQTAPAAIVNWSSFNVGSHTTLNFDQSAGGASASSWAALNRVTSTSTSPSQILGQINAQGQVYIINPNGIVFGAGSQVNLHALVASSAAFSDSQFLSATSGASTGGLYGTSPTFTGATAPIIVEPGAMISTDAPGSATSGGGFVLLLGANVQNGGSITTPDGQTVLAAGANFILQPGYSVTGTSSAGLPTGPNLTATVVGSIVAPVGAGSVTNTGLVTATTGDITLTGSSVTQSGVLLATTSVSQRGTIHLLSDLVATSTATNGYALDPASSIVLAPGSATLILNDASGATALESQRASAIAASVAANQAYAADQVAGTLPALQYVRLPDVQNASRIEITGGGTVEFQAGSLTMATGGQLAVSAGTGSTTPTTGRVLVDAAATLDVSGSLAAVLPMSANAVSVQIEGYELRDDPLNRDTTNLNNATIEVDARSLVTVAANATSTGTAVNGYTAARDYTAGGLVEVSGELGNIGHTIDEYTASGGTMTLAAPLVVMQPGSVANIAGGAVTYQGGAMPQSWLIAANGQLYNANTAPSTLNYLGVYNGQTFSQARWNISATYRNPLDAPASYNEAGYFVGRDAGVLTVSAPTAVIAGTIDAGVVAGPDQNTARTAGITDPFLQPQNAVPLGGTLALYGFGNYALASTVTGLETLPSQTTVAILDPSTGGATTSAAVGTTTILASTLTGAQLGGLSIEATGGITLAAPITLGDGAAITFTAPSTVIAADITAHAGSLSISDTLTLGTGDTANPLLLGNAATAALTQNEILAAGVTIDTSGLWTNALLDPGNLAGEAYLNGGPVSFISTRGISLGAGSLIDASSGGAITALGADLAGAGGAITLNADTYPASITTGVGAADPVTLAGTLRSLGATTCPTSGGCGFTLTAPAIAIGNGLTPVVANQVVLPTSFFASGFLSYTLNGTATTPSANGKTLVALADANSNPVPGVAVAPGAQLQVLAPTYQFTVASAFVPTGADPASALAQGLAPLYQPNLKTATLTQRPAASLSLLSDVSFGSSAQHLGGAISIGSGATISVDPTASVSIKAVGAITVAGTIRAPGGTISLINDNYQAQSTTALTFVPGQMILLAPGSTLDVSGQAYTTSDLNGRPFGTVPGGGNIFIGGPDVLPGANATLNEATDAFVVIAAGATLNASGTQALIDPAAGLGAGVAQALNKQGSGNPVGARLVPSAGGTIALNSETGIILDGLLLARSGGAGAAGGTLSIQAETPNYLGGITAINGVETLAYFLPDYLRTGRDLFLQAQYQQSGLNIAALGQSATASAALQGLVGQTHIGVDQITAGGFDTVTLSTQDALVFNGSVVLSAGRSISLTAGAFGEANATLASVVISAPYVALSGTQVPQGSSATTYQGEAIYATLDPAAIYFPKSVPSPTAANPYLGAEYNNGKLTGANQPLLTPAASLTINAAQIDIAGAPQFGEQGAVGLCGCASAPVLIAQGATPTGGIAATNWDDFAAINLVSQGGIRFLAPSSGTGAATVLETAGNITLRAQQIYPASNASAYVIAGAAQIDTITNDVRTRTIQEAPGASITIGSTGGPAPLPQSIEGALTFVASTIDQAGTVRAPLGTLQFGVPAANPFNVNFPGPAATGTSVSQTVLFAPGSITSVSARGLTIADGGTTDGVNYTGSPLLSSLPAISVTTASLTEQPGAVLDLGGGGTLSGIGFITGSGGSVDTLATPALTLAAGGKQTTDPVYAIVVGPQPAVAEASLEGYAAPGIGQQIVIPAGIPGLPPGTYTLLPADNALRPGGFRVELTSSKTLFAGPVAAAAGSYQIDVRTATAGTAFVSPLPVVASITPAAGVRDDAQYDEETYTQFITAQAALQGLPRTLTTGLTANGGGVLSAAGGYGAIIPEDAGLLTLRFVEPTGATVTPPGASAITIAGNNDFAAAPGGFGGQVSVIATSNTLEITPQPAARSVVAGATLLLDAADLNRIGAAVLAIGGTLDAGATLAAPEIVFTGTALSGAITTIAGSGALQSSPTNAITYAVNLNAVGLSGSVPDVLIAANANLQLSSSFTPSGPLVIGPNASLAAGGSLIFAAQPLTLPTTAQYGAANIQLATSNIILGTPAALTAAAGHVPTGITLTSDILAALVAGNPGSGAPALQNLTLTASSALDVFGPVNLVGTALQQFELITPSIQGYSLSSSDVATISAGTFVWNGYAATAGGTASAQAPSPLPGGPGSGDGGLRIAADTIILGFADGEVAPAGSTRDRVLFGFSNVTLAASQAIIARNTGSLITYQTGGLAATQPATGTAYTGTGGSLTLDTPLLAAANGAVLQLTSGGPLTVQSSSGQAANLAVAGQGGEIDITASAISLSTSIAAPAGKLSMLASTGDITLTNSAAINLAGVTTTLFDQSVASPGGSLVLEATDGNITAAPGSLIDVSAQAANAGSITATAGAVALNGNLSGASLSGTAGTLTLRTGTLSQSGFDQLQTELDAGGFTGGRAIEVGTGNIAVTGGAGAPNQVRASQVSLSVDQGSLSVSGVIDASGATPGSIALASGNNLSILAGAVLDAHATQLQTDSNGVPIDAENQASISLTVATGRPGSPGAGTLSIASGATLNVSSPEAVTSAGVAPGIVTISLPRILTASGGETGRLPLQIGSVTVQGVGNLVINGFRAYAPTTSVTVAGSTTPTATIAQADFTTYNTDSQAFITAAEPAGALSATLAAALGSFATNPALHLRPGVAIDTAGNLAIAGDINLAGYRYASLDPADKLTSTYGSGEPGALVIRAGGNVTVNGSITDGFALPNDTGNPDDNGWILTTAVSALLGNVVLPSTVVPTTLAGSATGTSATATSFPDAGALNYPITVTANTIKAGTTLPVAVKLGAALTLPAGTTLTANVTNAAGAVVPGLTQGSVLTTAQTVPAGDTLAAGFATPAGVSTVSGQSWPAGASLAVFSNPVVLAAPVAIAAGDLIPSGSTLVTVGGKPIELRTTGTSQGLIYADAAPLAQGLLSWSIAASAGANLAAADPLAVQPSSALAGSGNLVLSDPHVGLPGGSTASPQASFSVIRTGTGNLTLVAGGNFSENTLFGVYTSGAANPVPPASQIVSEATSAALSKAGYATAAAANAQAYALAGGGNLTLIAQGSVSDDLFSINSPVSTTAEDRTAAIGQWLWRQGGSNLAEPASWGINPGTYAPGPTTNGTTDILIGFTGLGALGGGNVTIIAGGNAGELTTPTSSASASISGGLVVAVASSSYVDAHGTRQTAGGGNITLRVGGTLNPASLIATNAIDADGTITDLRGITTITAGAIGEVGAGTSTANLGIYTPSPTALLTANPQGGPALVPGDAQFFVTTRGDLALAGTGDATRQSQFGAPGGSTLTQSWFTLWTRQTSITLQSAGGNISPVSTNSGDSNVAYNDDAPTGAAAGGFEMPAQLRIVADTGNYIQLPASTSSLSGIVLAPASSGQLDLLVGGSISNANISMSGADPGTVATVADPADYVLKSAGATSVTSSNIILQQTASTTTPTAPQLGIFPLFAFGQDVATPALHANDNTPAHIYAGGDIVFSTFGQQFTQKAQYYPIGSTIAIADPTLNIVAKSQWLRAGGDIVALGTNLAPSIPTTLTAMVLLNSTANSLSLVQAGRDIVESNVEIYGQGTLEVSAGRQLYQAASGTIVSAGPILAGSLATSAGAAVDVLAGMGSAGPDDAAFAALYFNPANLADPATPLQDQPGKVLQTYQNALLSFMQSRGYTGPPAGALAAFNALSPVVQTPFVLEIFFQELAASGRAAADPSSRFYKTYVQGNEAIAALFPAARAYAGNVTMFGGSGIKTLAGGGIALVVPGGVTELGVASQPASASSGVLTQGSGDIGIYSQGSVLLGQSRVFTTFGGGITIWSADGDVNAGQGAKTTQVFTPPSITYDLLGNVTLSPTAPATGAGIATLSPVSGIPAGDVVLVAPLGTIDAGEAGIRATGNVALAATTVLNAANVQSGGKTTGAPTVAVSDVTANLSAANTAGQSSVAANTMANPTPAATPSAFITVEVDIGNGTSDDDQKKKRKP